MIDVRDITKTYQMGQVKVHAIRGMSFEIVEGEFVDPTPYEKGEAEESSPELLDPPN